MKSPEQMGSAEPRDAMTPMERFEKIGEHYEQVPPAAKKAAHHKETGSSRMDEFKTPEFDDKTDLELRTPEQIIYYLTDLMNRLHAANTNFPTAEALEAEKASNPAFRVEFNRGVASVPDIPYITDKIESGEYVVAEDQKQHIYELLAVIKLLFEKLGVEVPETYTTKTFEESQLEGEQEAA